MKNKTSKKIKIALVATSTKWIGGQSIQAKRLMDAFEADENIEFIFIPNNPDTVFQKIKFLRTIFKSLKFLRLLLQKIPQTDFVLVSSAAMTGYIISTLPPLLIAKIFGKKAILNYHSGDLEAHIKKWKNTALPTMKMFDEIVVPSHFLVDVFAKFGLKARAVFNFTDTEKFFFRERKTLRPVFLSNRNFDVHYNVSCILRAFRIIQNKLRKAKLIVAGYGREESKLKKLADELCLENIEFTGKVPNEKMPEIYNRADIFLNASIVDNMPLSFIEAFACGLPIVSSNAGGIPYIIENEKTGILVETNDCHALAAEALKLLANNDLAQEIIENGRKEVEKYRAEKIKNDWINYFQSLNPQ